MVFDRALATLARGIEGGSKWPRPLCPTCQEGYIRFAEPEEVESPLSVEAREHEAWEPEWIFGTFAAAAECENGECRQKVHGVGNFTINTASNVGGYDDLQYSVYFKVAYLSPPLVLMRLPESSPVEVRLGVDRASALLFADPGLAATALRAAVERFLTTEGIPAERPSGRFKTLDDRIREWKDGDSSRSGVADLLLAVKWIGNAGTHEVADLSVKDVLDGLAILDEAFHRLFVGPDIDARAQAINADKGPRAQGGQAAPTTR